MYNYFISMTEECITQGFKLKNIEKQGNNLVNNKKKARISMMK